ncbi:MAG: sulfate adenylyltransferase [Bacillota bacterium]|nr:sulfate adenylyltransferase [Bacillota bacterium]
MSEPRGAALPPYGGRLVDRRLPPVRQDQARAEALRLRALPLPPHLWGELELIADGGYSPLEGFMEEADYLSVLERARLANGLPWGLPVVFRLPPGWPESERPQPGERLRLEAAGRPVAVLEVRSVFRAPREREAEAVFGTRDPAHPGVARLEAEGEWAVGGPILLLESPPSRLGAAWARYRLRPAQTRALFLKLGWRRIVAFQTRNPIHRAHEYLLKCALEIADGLLIHPLVGETRPGEVPADVRLRAYEALLRRRFPAGRAVLALYPAAMRYAGPREALMHAIARRNYGATHLIVGRDHAGVGGYYGPYDAQRLFDRFDPGELGIEILRFEAAFFCRACGGMATAKTCPHGPEERLSLSGTEVRARLGRGEPLPPEFTRPEVAAVLEEAAGSAPQAREARGKGAEAGGAAAAV